MFSLLFLACTPDADLPAADSSVAADSAAADDSSPTDDSGPAEGDCAPMEACGTIEYAGDATGHAVFVVLHDAEPPTGPPLGLEELSDVSFPLEFSVEVPSAASYYYRVFLDVDPDDGAYPNDDLDPQNDPEGTAPSVVPESGGADAVVIELLDPA